MRHRRARRKFNRVASHRLRMLQHLAEGLFRHYQVSTTLEKAKEARPYVEPLITLAKRADPQAQRQIRRKIHDKLAYRTLMEKLGPHFAERPGGYVRVIRLGRRPGDGGEMAVLELVDREKLGPAPGKPTAERKAARRKAESKEKVGGASA